MLAVLVEGNGLPRPRQPKARKQPIQITPPVAMSAIGQPAMSCEERILLPV
jgi:hypothetical protein